jgi:hypothetical protein
MSVNPIHSRAATAAVVLGIAAASAHAGVVATPTYLNVAVLQFASNNTPPWDYGESGVAMNGPVSYSSPIYGSGLLTQFTSQGFELTINSTAQANNQSFTIIQYFSVTDAVNYSLIGGAAASGSHRVQMRRITGMQSGVPTGPAVFDTGNYVSSGFNFAGTIDVGNYYIQLEFGRTGATNAQLFDLDFTPVPAPGALAVLCTVGFIRRRRR